MYTDTERTKRITLCVIYQLFMVCVLQLKFPQRKYFTKNKYSVRI